MAAFYVKKIVQDDCVLWSAVVPTHPAGLTCSNPALKEFEVSCDLYQPTELF